MTAARPEELRTDMGETCVRDELRTLFLFEDLSDEQLDTLCQAGSIEKFPAGPIVTEGDPATCFYVMLDGELVMSKRSGWSKTSASKLAEL